MQCLFWVYDYEIRLLYSPSCSVVTLFSSGLPLLGTISSLHIYISSSMSLSSSVYEFCFPGRSITRLCLLACPLWGCLLPCFSLLSSLACHCFVQFSPSLPYALLTHSLTFCSIANLVQVYVSVLSLPPMLLFFFPIP